MPGGGLLVSPRTIVLRTREQEERAIAAIRQMPAAPLMEVVIREHKSKRSLADNRLLWLWYREIAAYVFETTGQQYNADDVHEWMKAQMLGRDVVTIGGDMIAVARSSAKLSVSDFSDYLLRIDHYCAENLGLQLSRPEDLWLDAMREAG
jgi:hypothetical protein